MSEAYYQQIREMLAGVEKFIYDDSIEVNQVASYIMGQVMFHDDYDEISEMHKDIWEVSLIKSKLQLECRLMKANYNQH